MTRFTPYSLTRIHTRVLLHITNHYHNFSPQRGPHIQNGRPLASLLFVPLISHGVALCLFWRKNALNEPLRQGPVWKSQKKKKAKYFQWFYATAPCDDGDWIDTYDTYDLRNKYTFTFHPSYLRFPKWQFKKLCGFRNLHQIIYKTSATAMLYFLSFRFDVKMYDVMSFSYLRKNFVWVIFFNAHVNISIVFCLFFSICWNLFHHMSKMHAAGADKGESVTPSQGTCNEAQPKSMVNFFSL